jgi:hypothetical protein
MMASGTLPAGFTVKKRKLVKVKEGKKSAKRARRDSIPEAA